MRADRRGDAGGGEDAWIGLICTRNLGAPVLHVGRFGWRVRFMEGSLLVVF